MDDEENKSCAFNGFSFERKTDNHLGINHNLYLKRIEEVPQDVSFEQFISIRILLAWMANTRPDFQLDILQLAPVTEDRFEMKIFLSSAS